MRRELSRFKYRKYVKKYHKYEVSHKSKASFFLSISLSLLSLLPLSRRVCYVCSSPAFSPSHPFQILLLYSFRSIFLSSKPPLSLPSPSIRDFLYIYPLLGTCHRYSQSRMKFLTETPFFLSRKRVRD